MKKPQNLFVRIRPYINQLELIIKSNPEIILETVTIYSGTEEEIIDAVEYLRDFVESEPKYKLQQEDFSSLIRRLTKYFERNPLT